jgi:hypothetical protein
MLGQKLELMNETGQSASTTGETKQLMRARAQRIAARLVAAKKTGTTPTLDAKVQYSFDQTRWKDLDSFTQVTTSAAAEEVLTFSMIDTPIAPFYRAVTTIGGTAGPTYDVRVELWYE